MIIPQRNLLVRGLLPTPGCGLCLRPKRIQRRANGKRLRVDSDVDEGRLAGSRRALERPREFVGAQHSLAALP